MSGIVLTVHSSAILGPIAKFLGWVMNGIYQAMYNWFGVESVILSIAIITLIIYMLLLPLTIKQQKFSKLQQAMQPEIQAIQAKYKDKKDQASVQAMNEETQFVYQKYGVSPMGSCVQLLIQMPILFALYRVFYNIPAYVGAVKNNYSGLAEEIIKDPDSTAKLTQLVTDFNFNTASNLTAKNVAEKLSGADGETLKNFVIDILYKVPSNGWQNTNDVVLSSGGDAVTTLTGHFSNLGSQIADVASHIEKFNYLFGMNISDTPLYLIKYNFMTKNFGLIILALMIPVLAYVTQLISIKMMPTASDNGNDQMAQQMKTMNLMMPLMSLFIGFTVPVGLGFYWIMTAVVRSIQQYFINRSIKNLNLDEIIEKNKEKAAKKREKMGIAQDQIRQAAAIKTKSLGASASTSAGDDVESLLAAAEAKKAGAHSSSLAAKANLVRDFNEGRIDNK